MKQTSPPNAANAPKYHIIWQKWEDPLTKLKNNLNLKSRIQDNLSDFDENQDEADVQNVQNVQNMQMMHAIPMISTPMGVMPAPMSDMSTFNFWLGHTNFNITFNIWQILNTTPGVETLDIFSPYRFRMAIGQAFSTDVVKYNVAVKITQYLKSYAKAQNDIPT